MGNTEKTYERVTEAEEMIQKLCEKQPEVLWCVRPGMVAVLGINNKERTEKNKTLAKIKPIKGCEKAILQDNNIPVRYVIELYWSDWNEWKERTKQWIVFHELLHIHHDVGKTIKHDCEDFKIVLDQVGVNWTESEELPDLINGDVKFDLNLRPSLEDIDEEDRNAFQKDVEEIEKENEGKKAKETKEKDDEKEDDDEDVLDLE